MEEVAWIYENTVAKGATAFDDSGKYIKHIFKDSNNQFNILIEVDDFGNIMNAYPYLN